MKKILKIVGIAVLVLIGILLIRVIIIGIIFVNREDADLNRNMLI